MIWKEDTSHYPTQTVLFYREIGKSAGKGIIHNRNKDVFFNILWNEFISAVDSIPVKY